MNKETATLLEQYFDTAFAAPDGIAKLRELIKEKKIKKPKPLPPINPEEVTYAMPQGWEWMRLGELIELISGQHLTPDKYNKSGLHRWEYLADQTMMGKNN